MKGDWYVAVAKLELALVDAVLALAGQEPHRDDEDVDELVERLRSAELAFAVKSAETA